MILDPESTHAGVLRFLARHCYDVMVAGFRKAHCVAAAKSLVKWGLADPGTARGRYQATDAGRKAVGIYPMLEEEMGENTDDVMLGVVCSDCGVYLGPAIGYPRKCRDCRPGKNGTPPAKKLTKEARKVLKDQVHEG